MVPKAAGQSLNLKKLKSWAAGAILGPIALGVLGFFWGVYTDLVGIKASERVRDDRMDRFEKSYDERLKRTEALVMGIYDHLIGARDREALLKKIESPNR